ncbi:YecA family protein [Vibrio plantisponsor]|uniref:YecA family protein n=1 Tax=Vibrio plantisponsor TaxID=664643 RepID=A0ABU4IFS0_9VIBR|nr:YecA family protein [Vibrio plantisponsor]MDW6017411.1 YecA family protein [Vibrio plantisponsor]NNM42205.1 YecA family protein [Vibrio plantisponsor]
MSYQFVNLSSVGRSESPAFIEGVVLAANLATKPLDPETWLSSVFGDQAETLKTLITDQINAQYHELKLNEYGLLSMLEQQDVGFDEALADFAEGFMTLWPAIEPLWQEVATSDGSIRMLQALLTTLMLVIDEEQTHEQMKQAGFSDLPKLENMVKQLDLMIHEVALAADEAMIGTKTQNVNPYKDIGRNEICPCGSGKKFKHCCGN